MTVIRENETLKNHPYFTYLSDSAYQEIQDNLYSRAYKKGQVLFDTGDERNRMFFLKKGLVKFEKIDSSATFFYLDFIKEETLFPLTGLFVDETYYYSALAMTDIEVYYIPTKVFEKVIQENQKQLLVYLEKMTDISKRHMTKIQSCVTSSAFSRVKNTLAILMNDLGEENHLGQTHVPYPILMNDISRSSGTTRETASFAIKKLVSEKRLRYLHKELTFYDIDYFSLDSE